MLNPYVRAIADAADHVRRQIKPRTAPENHIADRVLDFFAAIDINHAGNRARVLTGIAHTMDRAELLEAIERLTRDAQELADKLRGLDAPAIIVTNAGRKYDPQLAILRRVLAQRPGARRP